MFVLSAVSSMLRSRVERPELTSVLVARSSPGHYGELIMYDLPSGQVPAPDLVNSDIQKEPAISEYITPLDLQGSTVLFGEMQMVLLADTVLYVPPLYVQAQGNTAVPELNRIIAVNGERIAMAETLAEAVAGGSLTLAACGSSDSATDTAASDGGPALAGKIAPGIDFPESAVLSGAGRTG